MTRHLGSCSPRPIEDKPITANQEACQSVSESSSSAVFDRTGKSAGKKVSIKQLVLVSQKTRTVFTANFLKKKKKKD